MEIGEARGGQKEALLRLENRLSRLQKSKVDRIRYFDRKKPTVVEMNHLRYLQSEVDMFYGQGFAEGVVEIDERSGKKVVYDVPTYLQGLKDEFGITLPGPGF